jgi:hypothetical protein
LPEEMAQTTHFNISAEQLATAEAQLKISIQIICFLLASECSATLILSIGKRLGNCVILTLV